MAGKQPSAEKGEYDRAFEGVDFPASRFEILERARDKGGMDHEVIAMLERLPQDDYETLESLVADVRALYIDDGYDSSLLPL